jgi:16S rRNA (adenine1518-N6/adenine1519-N6)-dimethyltransferase
VTFPILHLLVQQRHLLKEGVIMVQEEVAEKILKTGGRGYGYISLYFQYYFEWKKLDKVPPSSFQPPPKVNSRLLYFRPKSSLAKIPDEVEFWKFIKTCFRQPRRTLKNNLMQTHYAVDRLDEKILGLRAQQMKFNDFMQLWHIVYDKDPI